MIISLHDLKSAQTRHCNEKIILTSGTFDLFHVGHLHYLQAVKTYGDILVVMLSSDHRVKARKGPKRPIISEGDRAEILDALSIVDYVFIDIGSDYQMILDNLQPNLYVTDGEDIRFSDIIDQSKQIILHRKEGGKHTSTTAIIEHIKNLK